MPWSKESVVTTESWNEESVVITEGWDERNTYPEDDKFNEIHILFNAVNFNFLGADDPMQSDGL